MSMNAFKEWSSQMTGKKPISDTEYFYAAQVPYLNSLAYARDTKRYYDDYRKNTGIKEVKYPSRTYTQGNASGVVSAVASYGVRKMTKLYDD